MAGGRQGLATASLTCSVNHKNQGRTDVQQTEVVQALHLRIALAQRGIPGRPVATHGMAFGLWPICWIVFCSVRQAT